MKKIIIGAIILGVGITAWFWGQVRFFAPETAQARYRFTQVERRDMVNTVSATGTLSALITVEVGSEVSGQIQELLVDFNSPVTENQVIAKIDPEGYETLMRQAEAELDMAKAGLGIQKAEVLRYQADLENVEASLIAAQAQTRKERATFENAERNLKRQQSLVEKDFISRNDYDLAHTAFEEASAQLEQAVAQERAAQSKVASARVSLSIAEATVTESQAQVRLKEAARDKRKVDLDNTVIRSPVDGVIIDRTVDVGQTIAASLQAPTLFTIAQDLHQMEVSTSVDEADIGNVREGQPARFTVDAFGTRKFRGTVTQIRKLGKTVQNVVTYEVIISADNHDLSLMPGMTADVEIEILKRPQVLTVSNAALRFTPPDAPTVNASSPAGTAGAASGIPGGGRPDPEARIKEYTEQLDLSESQQDEVRTIFQQMGKKMVAARSAHTGPRASMSDVRDKIVKESQTAIMRILDSRQRELFEENRDRNRPKSGSLWRIDDEGELVMMPVILGSSDGSHTEIKGRGVTEGMQVIRGME